MALYKGGGGGTLGAPKIQQIPPTGMAFEPVTEKLVRNYGLINILGNVVLEGGINIGTAGVNVSTYNFTFNFNSATSPDESKRAQALLKVIDTLADDVEQIPDQYEDDRDDTIMDLQNARKAGEEGKAVRLKTKLQDAQTKLTSIGENEPRALELARAVGVALQRASALDFTPGG